MIVGKKSIAHQRKQLYAIEFRSPRRAIGLQSASAALSVRVVEASTWNSVSASARL
jgi:hypothetical protein